MSSVERRSSDDADRELSPLRIGGGLIVAKRRVGAAVGCVGAGVGGAEGFRPINLDKSFFSIVYPSVVFPMRPCRQGAFVKVSVLLGPLPATVSLAELLTIS